MSTKFMRHTLVFALVAVGLCLGLSACGSSGSSSSATTQTGANGETEPQGGSSGAAAAKAAIAPYLSKPSAFPVTEKLKEIPTGATMIYLDCGTPTCATVWQHIEQAGTAMGVNVEDIRAGEAANTVAAAFQSALTKHPDAVIVSPIDLHLWSKYLKEFEDANIAVVPFGVLELQESGLEGIQAAEPALGRDGRLMADYIAAEFGSDSNVAYYQVPELPFTTIEGEEMTAELEKVCPECSVRTVPVAAEEIGTTASSTIVSDLQSHPETTVAAFSVDELGLGLPAALHAAGIEVKIISEGAEPSTLQAIKEGQQDAAIGIDYPVFGWTLVDQAAREIVGQKLTGDEAKGLGVFQFLTKNNLGSIPSGGWTAYPNYAEMFKKLWGVS